MRTQAKLKLGYYPLALAEARRIRNYLQFLNEPASIIDPCAGTGTALCALSDGAAVRRYGVELDAYRAEEARKSLDEVIHGSAFDTHAPVDSFSLLYLNPPYDFEIGEGKNERMERLFLEHLARWVRPGGRRAARVPAGWVRARSGVRGGCAARLARAAGGSRGVRSRRRRVSVRADPEPAARCAGASDPAASGRLLVSRSHAVPRFVRWGRER